MTLQQFAALVADMRKAQFPHCCTSVIGSESDEKRRKLEAAVDAALAGLAKPCEHSRAESRAYPDVPEKSGLFCWQCGEWVE